MGWSGGSATATATAAVADDVIMKMQISVIILNEYVIPSVRLFVAQSRAARFLPTTRRVRCETDSIRAPCAR